MSKFEGMGGGKETKNLAFIIAKIELQICLDVAYKIIQHN